MRHLLILSVVMTLGACGDPLATFPRLTEADIPEDPTVLSVSTDPADARGEQAGFFARLLGSGEETKIDDSNLPPEVYGARSDVSENEEGKQGLMSLFSTSEKAPTSDVSAGTTLPYGEVARICDLPRAKMGKKVAQFPERRPRHRLYDSDPGNTAPHTFYLTGFADGCARQFTASLALFGSVGMHEQLRYGLPAEVQPYSKTDKSYEKLKSQVCGVPRKKPCGRKIDRLESNTVFLSIYESFGDNERWSNLLLHDGRLLAQDTKS
ncbi:MULTISPECIES: hypothetical protein [unclassified Roseovarius]|uniref:hypothetical protein n=1 Tax=unclassified Roseovarius TaxID=2614913 RepID=UPI00273D0EE9|nr:MULTISPECIES: hypothetical protein [unclassified Roseovarius]